MALQERSALAVSSMGRCNAILNQGGDIAMKRRTQINYTPEQKAIIWDRYKQGDSLHDIARMFDRYHSSIMTPIHQTGGYRPSVRKRHRLALSLDAREEILKGLVAKLSIRDIAASLSRVPSTISREVRRHGRTKQYRAAKPMQPRGKML